MECGGRHAAEPREGALPLGGRRNGIFARHRKHRFSGCLSAVSALGITKLFLDKLADKLLCRKEISLTTYRAGGKADTGWRDEYCRLGFTERELLVEYGYPTQRFVLPPKNKEEIPQGYTSIPKERGQERGNKE